MGMVVSVCPLSLLDCGLLCVVVGNNMMNVQWLGGRRGREREKERCRDAS